MTVVESGTLRATHAALLLSALTELNKGDASVRLPRDWTGLSGKLSEAFNRVVELNETMALELRRLRQTVGEHGKLRERAALGDVAALKDTINEMIRNLEDTTQKNTGQDWLKTNLAKFSRMLQGQKALEAVGGLILSELAPVVAATHAEFYVLDSSESNASNLMLVASYAAQGRASHGKRVDLGQGLVGQCALERRKILLTRVPQGYLDISSGLGEARPRNMLVLPIIFQTRIKGVLELASFEGFSDTHQAFLDQLMESIGIVIDTIEANTRTEDLLVQSQLLARELQNRQEELQQTNQELQEKARLLAHQNQEVERKNQEVEQARQALEDKARQLALTSKYKSEFLANMSHELRTPLNSLLILSDQLCLNPEHNLSSKQVEFAKIIHASGNELLGLINDILDLSKIESGTVAVNVGELRFGELKRYVERTFRHIAESNNVRFAVRLDPSLRGSMFTDVKRLQQIIKNLLSNAFKFTHQGAVSISIQPAGAGWNPGNEELNRASEIVAFAVSDTGIGIPPDKQQIVFEAFQQVDGSTSRKFGGTGLGLAISRELSRLLHGEIGLTSKPGKGSVFTLYLPATYFSRSARTAADAAAVAANAALPATMRGAQRNRPLLDYSSLPASERVFAMPIHDAADDRDMVQPGERVVLIVENDADFSRFLLETARGMGFKGLVSSMGIGACALMLEYRPSAMILDTQLGDIDAWRLLARLKNDLATRHIPVCVISDEDDRDRAIRAGAMGFVAGRDKAMSARVLGQVKAHLDRTSRRVLVMDDKPVVVATIKSCIEGLPLVEVLAATDLMSAYEAIKGGACDCIVLGGDLAHTMLAALAREVRTSGAETCTRFIIFYPAADRVDATREALAQPANTTQVVSLERLLDQVTLALHQDIEELPQRHRGLLTSLHDSNQSLAGKKVLIVDDDVRNIFALSAVLEEYDVRIVSTENGRGAIGLLRNQPDVDIVLMDIMMPELDGFDTIKEMRGMDSRRNLPIVAVTAKAMKGDRERCMAAGAWDYLSKPVDRNQLMRVLRVWLPC